MTDLHVHTIFCDGRDTPEEMVKSAVKKGLKQVGILCHSYVPFDDCCISIERTDEFESEVKRLKEKYLGQIDVLLGVEADIFSPQSLDGFDYVIGSVHYLKHGGEYIAVDDTPQMLRDMIERYYGGDFYACAEDYFATVAKWLQKKPDIIGHFDLIKKFRREIPFDTENPRYKAAWQSAADKLLKLGVPFEVNTGGISRGWLAEPYPSREIADYIIAHGGKLILSSDAHRKEDIAAHFQEFEHVI